MRRARSAGPVAVAALLVSAAACSLLHSLDGYADGAGGLDGATDADPADVGVDVVVDASDAGVLDAGPLDPCDGAVFCDRFERNVVDDDNWQLYVQGDASLTFDTTTYTSPTKSLLALLPEGASPQASLTSATYADVDYVRLRFSFKLDELGRRFIIMRTRFAIEDDDPEGLGTRSVVVDLSTLADRLVVSEQVFGGDAGSAYGESTVATDFQLGVWQRWEIEVDARSGGLAVVRVDDKPVVRRQLTNVIERGDVSVVLGPLYAPTGPPARMWYDDFALFLTPPP